VNDARPTLGPLAAGVILLTLVTVAIHFYLAPIEFGTGATLFGVLFVLNGLGYLTMLAVIYAPLGFLAPFRLAARVILIVIAAASIGAYFYVGVFDTIGWVDKAVEAGLILLVLIETVSARGAAEPAPR
jgi:hypothetical protein